MTKWNDFIVWKYTVKNKIIHNIMTHYIALIDVVIALSDASNLAKLALLVKTCGKRILQ